MQVRAFLVPYEYFASLDGLAYERYTLQKDDVSSVPVPTQQRGFYFMSPHYLYSKASMVGVGQPLKQDGVAWMEQDWDDCCRVCRG